MTQSLHQWGKRIISVLRHRRIRILAYHNIAISALDPFCTSPQVFTEQIQILAESKIPIISLDQAYQNLLQSSEPDQALVITFDDGYVELMKYAVPVLLRYRFPATIFVVTGKIGQHSDWGDSSPSYSTLTWDDLSFLSSIGFTIGSHTHTHRPLTSLDLITLQSELINSQELIQIHTGETFIPLAYPFGDFSEREKIVANNMGYPCAIAAGGLWGNGNETQLYALRRELILNTTGLSEFRRIILGNNDLFRFISNRF